MNYLLGMLLIVVSAASFGAMPIFARFAYDAGINTASLLFFRFFLGALFMIPIALARKRRFPKGRDLLVLIAMGAVGYAGQAYTFFTALTLIPASLVSILLYLYPIFVAVLSVFFLGEVLTGKRIFALGIAVSGAALVIGFEIGGHLAGILYGVSAALIYSVYNIVGAWVMKRNDTLNASLVIILSAAGVYLGMGLFQGMDIPTQPEVWISITAIGFVSTFVAISAYFKGMTLIGPVNASMLSTFEPVTTVLLAALFLDQYIGWSQILGGALILCSALIVASHAGNKEQMPSQSGSDTAADNA
ncbi:MAG: DMT family transporter [Desulfobacter sp.]